MQIETIKAAVDSVGLPVKTVAEWLFPTNKHPKMALDRVFTGESELCASQIETLKHLTGKDYGLLFGDDETAFQVRPSATPEVFELNSRSYKAVLFPERLEVVVQFGGDMKAKSLKTKDTDLKAVRASIEELRK